MKPRKLVNLILDVVLIISLGTGCGRGVSPAAIAPSNSSSTSQPEVTGPTPPAATGEPNPLTVPATLEASPEEAAAALLDPNRVEQGVWFLLRGLGIGVYTGDGKQVLAGSETGPQDFWIYDFEVPLIFRMAQEPSRPFSEFLPLLAELGLKPGLEQALKQYKDGYAANPDAYLVHLFASTGLFFEGDPQITPLQEWLLLLDTFLPPNPNANAGMDAASWGRLAAAGILHLLEQTSSGIGRFSRQEQQQCGSIRGGSFIPNWGVANGFLATIDDLIEVGNAYYAIHGPMLARSVKAELRPNKSIAHEGHGGPGGSITFAVSLKIDYGGLNMTIMPPTCGLLVNNIINLDPSLAGALPGAKVWWKIISAFREHGTFKDVRGHAFDGSIPTETDPSGKTIITFQARQEPANGVGQVKSLKANLRASFDPRIPIEAMGLTDPRLLAFLPATMDVSSPESVTLEWHELANWTGEGTYSKTVQQSGVELSASYTFTIAFHTLPDGMIAGEGVLIKTEASYGGQGIVCKDIGTSGLIFPPLKVAGVVKPDGTFQLSISNSGSTNTWKFDCTTPAGSFSLDEGRDQGIGLSNIEIASADGAKADKTNDLSISSTSPWTGVTATATGSETWTLQIHKQAVP